VNNIKINSNIPINTDFDRNNIIINDEFIDNNQYIQSIYDNFDKNINNDKLNTLKNNNIKS